MSATYPKCQRNLFTPVYRKRIAERLAQMEVQYLGTGMKCFDGNVLSCNNSDIRNWQVRGVPADMDCEAILELLKKMDPRPSLFREAQQVPLEDLQVKTSGEVIEIPEAEEEISFEDIQTLMKQVQTFGEEVVRINADLRRDLNRVIKANADMVARVYELEEDIKRVDSRINTVKVVFPGE